MYGIFICTKKTTGHGVMELKSEVFSNSVDIRF